MPRSGRMPLILCREGWYFLVVVLFVLFGAILREINLLILVAGMMLGPLVTGTAIAVRAMRGVSVRRRALGAVHAGQAANIHIDVSNERPRRAAAMITVEDRIVRVGSSPAEAQQAAVFFPRVAGAGSETGAYRVRFFERGVYRLGPLRASTRFPFGFVRRSVGFNQRDELIVFPALGHLSSRFRRIRRQANADGAYARGRIGAASGDFYGLREWRSGDGRRLIHWRTSARSGSLVVRQFEQRQSRDLALVVDLCGARFDPEAMERALRFAATVAVEQGRQGRSRMLLAVAGKTVELVEGQVSRKLLSDALRTLAVAEASPTDALPQLMDQVLRRFTDGAGVLVVRPGPAEVDDVARFSGGLSVPGAIAALRRVQWLDATSESFATLYDDGPADESARSPAGRTPR